jgi:hypothetical protein
MGHSNSNSKAKLKPSAQLAILAQPRQPKPHHLLFPHQPSRTAHVARSSCPCASQLAHVAAQPSSLSRRPHVARPSAFHTAVAATPSPLVSFPFSHLQPRRTQLPHRLRPRAHPPPAPRLPSLAPRQSSATAALPRSRHACQRASLCRLLSLALAPKP